MQMVVVRSICPCMQERFGAIDGYINKYRAVFKQALEGEALTMLRDAREQGYASCLYPPLCSFVSTGLNVSIMMSIIIPLGQPFSDVT